uniref:Uncharacterized protein n=1 Tax=Arion vulgaris TaxID=1028688 RepID=A0A0B7AWP2_9EUPU
MSSLAVTDAVSSMPIDRVYILNVITDMGRTKDSGDDLDRTFMSRILFQVHQNHILNAFEI